MILPSFLSRLTWRGGVLALALAATGTATLQAGTPRVLTAFPGGGQRGTEVEVTFSGSALSDARTVLFEEPGFTVTSVAAKPGSFTAKVKVAPDARLGEHLYRVITKSGIADLRLFYVTPFSLVAEDKENPAAPLTAQSVPLNTTVYGRTQEEDEDFYLVEAKKGQRITAVVVAARLQTQNVYDTRVRITKEDGTLLSEVDDTTFGRQDPVASILAPEDGKYRISIKDSTNSGQGPCHYLLSIGTFVQPQAVYPGGGPAGTELEVQLLGDAAGPLPAKVKLPDAPTARFPYLAQVGDQPAPMPVIMRASPFPNVLEVEPNDEWKQVTTAAVALPVGLNGIIQKEKDIDFFKFTAKKGQVYDINVYARELRSPLDSVLTIYNAAGGRLTTNDDNTVLDSYLRWTAPADGDFYLSVSDQLQRGGPLFTYRVELKTMEPRLTSWLPEMELNNNQSRRAIPVPKGNRYATLLRVKRWDVAGTLKILAQNLPPGVKYHVGPMDKGVDTVAVVFEADPEAAPVEQNFAVKAELTEPPKDAPAVASVVEQTVDIVENGNQKAFYTVQSDKLAVAVTEPAPVKISLAAPKVPLLQNGSMALRVNVERLNGFKGPVTLGLLYAPPGVGSAGTTQVKEGETTGTLIISANDKAPIQPWQICLTATADPGTGAVWVSSELVQLNMAPPFVTGKIQRTFVDQGDSGVITVQLEHPNAFEGKAKVALQGLPPGVTAEEQEITQDTKEVRFNIKAAANAPAGQHRQIFCQFKLQKDGEEMLGQFAQGGVLRVDKTSVAKN